MTRDDIIRMMRSVCDTDKVDAWHNEFWTVTQDEIERFAALVTAEKDKEIERLREEVRVLRLYGNKDCTSMADEALKQETPR